MDGAVLERLPIGPTPVAATPLRLLDVAGAGEDFVVLRVGIDFDAAEAGECAGVEDVAGVFVGFGFAECVELAGVAGADEDSCCRDALGEAEALLRFDVSDVGVVAVLLNAEDVTAIAADGEQTVGLRGEGVDDVVFAGPDFARGLVSARA